MKQYKLSVLLISIFTVITIGGCSIEATYYSEVAPSNFFINQRTVWQRFNRPFTHWKYYMGEERFRFDAKQLGTDELILPTRGSDWYDNGNYVRIHEHRYDDNTGTLNTVWDAITMGIAHAWDTLEDIDNNVDFDAFDFPEGTRESMLNQLRALVAFYYLEGLDFFGGMPLYSTVNTPAVPRSTDVETFAFIEELLEMAIPNLPKKTTLGGAESSTINQATAAAFKMRLYLNAEAYIGKPMYKECADICKDIINGVYGAYALEEDWTMPFGFSNQFSKEILWSVPSEKSNLVTWKPVQTASLHYFTKDYTNNAEVGGGYNGYCLVPSLKPNGEKYDYKLGSPFSKFEDSDIRKQPYYYVGDGEYHGMFLMGKQVNPINSEWFSVDRSGEIIEFVDQVALLSQVGPGKKYSSVDELESNISTGEENSGIRFIKLQPIPNTKDIAKTWTAFLPEIRLAEVYYSLAECEFRVGDKAEAARLFNEVRKRYFPNGDPNPVTIGNIDKYRILDEWMIEFLCEARRRTDLIRWDVYVNDEWWAHPASKSKHLNRYPIHYKSLEASPLLEQNPGYPVRQ